MGVGPGARMISGLSICLSCRVSSSSGALRSTGAAARSVASDQVGARFRHSGTSAKNRRSVSSGPDGARFRAPRCVMATLRFLLKRFVAQRLLGLAVVVTLAFSIGVLVAGPIYADAAREAILSSQLTGAAPTVRNARLQVFGDQSFDWAAADEAITARTGSLPVERMVRQGLGTVRLGSPAGPSVSILAREGIEEHLEIRGEAPGQDEIVLHAGTSRLLAVRAGDTLAVIGPTGERIELTVSGTYVSPNRADPF